MYTQIRTLYVQIWNVYTQISNFYIQIWNVYIQMSLCFCLHLQEWFL